MPWSPALPSRGASQLEPPTLVTRRAIDRAVARARGAAPAECCGVLLSRGDELVRSVAVPNAATALDRFQADPLALMRVELAARRCGLSMAGYYHSHTAGGLDPSAADRVSGAWPGLGPRLHLIVSPAGDCRLFEVTARDWIERRIAIDCA